MNRATIVPTLLLLFLAATIGCGSTASSDDDANAKQDAAPAAADTSYPDSRQVAQTSSVDVPAGTVMTIEFEDTVSTESSSPGDRFVARVSEPVHAGGAVVIDSGSIVYGRVVDVKRGKKIGGKAKLDLEFTSLQLPNGDQKALDATFYSEGKSQAGKDAATIGGSTAGGAILGRIIGHQSDKDNEGTAIGAVVGAAIGTAIAASTDGQPVTIAAGTQLAIRLDSPVTVTI